ncbi:MAG: iron ABC transporter permease [Rhodospirillales bacterium]|nr:iron ABC transporter permease [Rhodospirillales bacterium]
MIRSGVVNETGRRARYNLWTLGTLLVAAFVAAPVLSVLVLATAPSGDIWRHLSSTVLPHYIETTLLLMAGVGAGTLVIGVGAAWVVTMCRFPGSRLFEWALLLPLAVPAYVIAYVYTDLLEYAGPVQGALREMFGWRNRRDYWFPEIRSLGGAVAMMTLVLYPYVYVVSRAAFLEQSVCVLEASRTLGKNAWQSFFHVALPLARPAIVIGVSLALMETLNDFGTVDYFAVKTFTAGIFDVWLNMSSTAGAAQLAAVMLAFVLAIIGLERWARRGRRFHATSTRYSALPSYRLTGLRALGAVLLCALPVAFGFLVPAGLLLAYAARHYEDSLNGPFLSYLANSLALSSSSAAIAVAVGLFLAYGVRLSKAAFVRAVARFASVGYALPGAVLAVGVMIPLAALDNAIDAAFRSAFGISTGLLLSGTTVAITIGYIARFLALSFGTVEASLTKITPSMDGAARTLGLGPAATLARVHLPMMRGSVLSAAILVFVDGMKELPMTMLLRPFNFDTLATYVHQFASREHFEEAAVGALAIVVAGMLPVILLSATIRQSRPGHAIPPPIAAPARALDLS